MIVKGYNQEDRRHNGNQAETEQGREHGRHFSIRTTV